ncbi:MAG TPA: HAD family phosphatase [Pyrinomonadaceae bacterium]|nr:HAD family phosphatase [Pyrinomonadaceae bacterium]
MSEEYRAVLWDMDGTLLRTTEQHWLAWRDALAAEGFQLTQELFAQSFGRSDDETLRGYLGADLSQSELSRICTAKTARYMELVEAARVELLPGVHDWLERLKSEGWRQAVASSATLEVIEAILKRLEVRDYFDAIVSCEDVERSKPDPQLFLLAAAKLGVKPARSVVVEDAPTGIEAARRARMRSIGVLTTHPALAGADITVQSLLELQPSAFEQLLHS